MLVCALQNRYTGCGRNRSPIKSVARRTNARGSSAATKCRPASGLNNIDSDQQSASAEKGRQPLSLIHPPMLCRIIFL